MLKKNLSLSNVCPDKKKFELTLRLNICETGKALTELPFIWFTPEKKLMDRIINVQGNEFLTEAISDNCGVVFITPHIGSFEIIPKYLSKFIPLTVMFKRPHKSYLEPIMLLGRNTIQITSASADLKGVRLLLKALKRGEGVGLLPDQVPKTGEGEWVNFFGRPAYTMTLASELARRCGARVVFTYAIRAKNSLGFQLHFEGVPKGQMEKFDTTFINRRIETIIRNHPSQYLWAYNRYKGATKNPASI